MAKLIVVTLDMLQEAEAEVDNLFAKDPLLQEILQQFDRWSEEEIARRDAAYSAEQMEDRIQESE